MLLLILLSANETGPMNKNETSNWESRGRENTDVGGLTKINRFPQWWAFCGHTVRPLRLCPSKDVKKVELLQKSTSFIYEACLHPRLRSRRQTDSFLQMQLHLFALYFLPIIPGQLRTFTSACSS